MPEFVEVVRGKTSEMTLWEAAEKKWKAQKKRKRAGAGQSKLGGGARPLGDRGVEERTTAQLISSLQACFCYVVGVGGLWLRAAVLIN